MKHSLLLAFINYKLFTTNLLLFSLYSKVNKATIISVNDIWKTIDIFFSFIYIILYNFYAKPLIKP